MSYDYITEHTSHNATRQASVPSVYGRPRKIKYLTIHHWGVDGQSFNGVVRYLCRKGGNTSAHEVIEAGRVAVIVNHLDAAWHAGSGKGNAESIGLELRPEATDADYATAAERIADLWDFYGRLPLVRHSDWKATACPGRWDLNRLEREAKAWQRSADLDLRPVPQTITKPAATTPKEPTLSAAEVAQINAHTKAQADRIIDYIAERTTIPVTRSGKPDTRSLATIVGNLEGNLDLVPKRVWEYKLTYRDQSRGIDRQVQAGKIQHYLSWGNAKTIDALNVKES